MHARLAGEPLMTAPASSEIAPGSRLGHVGDEAWRLIENVRGGMHLAFLQAVPPDRFHASPDQVALLLALNLATGLLWERLLTESPRYFDATGVAVQGACFVATLGLALFATRSARRPIAFSRMLVMLLAPLSTGWLGYALLELVGSEWLGDTFRGDVFALWLLPVYARTISIATGGPRFRVLALVVAHSAALYIGLRSWPSPYLYFTYDPSIEIAEETATVDAERLLHVQPARVAENVARLSPQRPGVVDLYFIGFAASSRQSVFRREVEYVRDLFDRRFDTAGRSIALINHADTQDTVPLASASNLEDALGGVARLIDPEEDVVFVYLTGHGSRTHALEVAFPGLPLNSIGRDDLSRALDASGIHWRVVAVSACYSGGFVRPLRGERSLVLTAAAADRTSFGCSDKAPLTYFADAYFKRELEHRLDFVAAFERARERIAAREAREGLEASRPQLALGAEIDGRLAALSERLRRDQRFRAGAPPSRRGTSPR